MMRYSVHGTNAERAVLLLHGFLGSGRDWDFLLPALIPDFRCVTVDLPGHGETTIDRTDRTDPTDPTTYDFTHTTAAILQILDELHIARCSVVGYSMGGRVALGFATTHADRVERLVLESASPGMRTEEERALRREQDARLADELETEPFEAFLVRWYHQPLFNTLKNHPERFAAVLDKRRKNDPLALAQSLRALGVGSQPSLWDAWAANRIPTLMIVGDQDMKFQSIASDMAAQCPAAQLCIIPGCGHNVHDENPEAYTEAVAKFLRGR